MTKEPNPRMSRNPSSIEFLHRPADLFQHLRSRHIPLEERIQSAQQHLAHQDFSLPCKQLYFLRWIFQVEFFEPNRSNKSSKAEPFTSPVHHTVFWKFLRQLVSDIGDSDLSSVLAGTPPIILLRHTLSEWHNLFNNPEFSLDVWSTLKVIFPIISQRLPFDLSLEILNQIFQGLNEFRHPISEPVEQIILLITNGVLPIIESTLNSRRAFNSIIMDHKALGRMLQAAFSPYATQPLKSLVFQIIQSFALNVENLKMVYLDQNTPIEWLDALHTIGKTSTSMAASVNEIVAHLVSALMCELPNLRSQVFSQLLANSAAQSSNNRTVAMDLAYLHATRTLILHVVKNSSHVLQELGSSSESNLAASMTSHKAITRQIVQSNFYDPGQPTQHEILDQLAHYSTNHLSNSSGIIAMDSLEMLVDLLSLDYTLIEVRLGTMFENLVVSPHHPNNFGPMRQFFDGVFNWFSKAKQIPNLLEK